MKKVSIVYSQPLTQIQGVNYVNNSFVMGGRYFAEKDLLLNRIYAPNFIFDCTTHDHLDLIGSNVGTKTFQKKRKLRVFLSKVFSSKFLFGSLIKMYFNYTVNSRNTIRSMSDDDSDYLIFQDLGSVREYYKCFGRRTRVKSVLILHCSNHPLEQVMPSFPGYYKYKFLKNKAFKKCNETMNMVNKVVYLSNHAFMASLLPTNKKTYIYNGIEDYKDIKVVEPSKPLQFVCVGSVSVHKGQLNLIRAISLLDKKTQSNLHLTIVGDGNEYEECLSLVRQKGLEATIDMIGQRNDVFEILKGMDVFILPSKSEGMPMSILEGMRQGLYVMGTETGAIPEMIGIGYGELISRDPQQLADSIKHVVNDNVVSFDAKQKSRKRFMNDFTLRTMIKRYSEVLLSL